MGFKKVNLPLEEIPISTRTIIACSNLEMDIESIFRTFPHSIRGVSSTQERANVCFETLYFGSEVRGQLEKKRKKTSFRNAINVVGVLSNEKKINFKVSKNGKFQLTGCKEEGHAFLVVEHFIQQMRQHCPPESVKLKDGETYIKVSFRTVMTNIDFSVGFTINRLKLDELVNKEKSMYSLLETSCGYTGVNIKFPLEVAFWKSDVPILSCEWDPHKVPFCRSIGMGSSLEVLANPQRTRYNTFLVFHSGNVIMSGMNIETMKPHYDLFLQLLKEWRPLIEEKILTN